MKIRTAATAAFTWLAVSATGIAIAQAAWPQLTQGDLEACRTVIAAVHRKEIAVTTEETNGYCTPGTNNYDAENCKNMRGWLAETKAADDVAWFFKGNDHCEGSDYPCFGPGLFNDARTGADASEWSQTFAEMAAKATKVTAGMEFWEAASEGDNCLAGLWVKKAKAAGFSAAVVAQPAPRAAPAPTPAPAKPSASDPTFQANLKQFAADQLFAMANDYLQRGDIDLAKLARNALLARFPDSPLVPIVAQLLANPPQAAAPAPASAPAPVAAPIASGQRVYMNDEASAIAAFARIGVVLIQTPGTKELLQDTKFFAAWVSDCSATQCKAIQLRSKYALSPLPSADRVATWNMNKLYGRGYLSGGFVIFDMVVPIPKQGIDLNDLKEAVDLYLETSRFFYEEVTKP